MEKFETLFNSVILDEKNTFSNLALATLLGASTLGGISSYKHNKQYDNTTISQPEQIATRKQVDPKLKNVIARTLWAEAKGDGEEGMRAVASVIFNRAMGNTNNIIPVIKKRKQFSCWNAMTESDWTDFKLKEKVGPEWAIANKIAEEMASGTFKVTTMANHYYNPDKCNPSWAKRENGEVRRFTVIGNHRFMRI